MHDPDAPAIDSAAIDALLEATGDDPAFLAELIDLFIEDGATQLATMDEATAAGPALDDCLRCVWFPAAHQARIRTTNGLERLSQELKRRTRVVRIFPNREACLRLVTALAAEHSDEWLSGRRYLDVGLLSDERHGLPLAAVAAD